jgi:hypothetical protein
MVAADGRSTWSLGADVRPACLVLAAALAVIITGCAVTRPSKLHPMDLCDSGSAPNDIEPKLLAAALVKAQTYSNEAYGPDCLVCAAIFADEPTEFILHITSPIETLINTSATITVRKSDGAVVGRAKYHSCHARRSVTSGT